MNDWWGYLKHSKGPWKEHKYVKIIDGVYYYPEGYQGGKYSMPDGKSEKSSNSGDSRKAALKGWTKKAYEYLDAKIEKEDNVSNAAILSWLENEPEETVMNLLDAQGIDWRELGLTESKLRSMAKTIYKHYEKKSGENSDVESQGTNKKVLKQLYKGLESFDGDPAELLDPNGKRGQDFSLTVAEFAGVSLKKMGLSNEEIEKLRQTAYNHYKKKNGKDDKEKKLSEEDLNRLALETIRGNYGNGQERKDKLGEHYAEIQQRVNEMMRSGKISSSSGSNKSKSKSESKSSNKNKEKEYRYKTTTKTRVVNGKKQKVIKRERVAIKHSDIVDDLMSCKMSDLVGYDAIMHYGMPRRSGRYPWGSGKEPYQSLKQIGESIHQKSQKRKEEKKKQKDTERRNRDEEKKRQNDDRNAKNERLRDSKYRRLLSDKSLNDKIKRFETEKKLKDLTEDDISPGYKYVKVIMSDVGKRVAVNALTGGSLYMMKIAASKEQFNRKDFGDAIFNGGPKRK